MRSPLAFAAFLALSVACSSPSAVTPPEADAGKDVAIDVGTDANGQPSDVYPAFKPSVPLATSVGGPVLTHAKVVPVFFPSDSWQAKITSFLGKYVPSSHWVEMVGEYGVSTATVSAPVVLATAPAKTIDDTEIQTWLQGQLDGTHAEWPAPDDSTLYVLFYPQTTSITLSGSASCKAFGGYHGDVAMPSTQKVAYAVIPRCSSSFDSLTNTLSHELVEGATDPYVNLLPAYAELDAIHMAWMLSSSGGEVGDMCEYDPLAPYAVPDLGGAVVQRSWSNLQAAAYHDPCVPQIPGATYFNSVPVLPDMIPVTIPDLPGLGPLAGKTLSVEGVKIPKGESRTIDVNLFSDGPTGGPWSVEAVDTLSERGLGSATLTFAWDATEGQNGQTLHLTITAIGKSFIGASAFQIHSSKGNQQFSWTGTVGMN
ncbi:MAG TPA: hypothetical protein VF316_09900 [Polyangiaceae bacterium]